MCSTSRILTVQYSAGRRRQIKAESPDYCNIIQDHNNNNITQQHRLELETKVHKDFKIKGKVESAFKNLRYGAFNQDCKIFAQFVSSSST